MVAPAVKQVVAHGHNACVFAYGQTGSGKTYTLYGATETKKTKSVDQMTREEIENCEGLGMA